MKKFNTKNKYRILLIFLSFLLLAPITYASYAVSSPRTITMEKGTSKEFDFQIQAYSSEQDLKCSYTIGNTTPFEIIFEEQGFEVAKKSASVIKGIIKAPKKIDDGHYSYNFCVSCTPKTKESGATTSIRFCGIPININIVSPEKKIKSPTKLAIIVGLSIMLLIFLILVIITIIRKLTKK